MKERPILMSGPMVRATLDDRKTKTRRVIVPRQSTPRVAPLTMEPYMWEGQQELDDDGLPCWIGTHPDYPTGEKWFSCPYGGVGDRLWVRETWATVKTLDDLNAAACYQHDRPPAIYYAAWIGAARNSENRGRWRPSIHMPRWACRLTLEILSVGVERLQDITEEDAIAEGCTATQAGDGYPFAMPARMNFVDLWDDINAKRGYGWAVNPWVWVIEYRRVL